MLGLGDDGPNSVHVGEQLIGLAQATVAFIDSLPPNAVMGIHTAGGSVTEGTVIDSHDHPVSDETIRLLGYVLRRQNPETIILERDRRLRQTDELLPDVDRIRAVVDQARYQNEEEDGQSESTRTSA